MSLPMDFRSLDKRFGSSAHTMSVTGRVRQDILQGTLLESSGKKTFMFNLTRGIHLECMKVSSTESR